MWPRRARPKPDAPLPAPEPVVVVREDYRAQRLDLLRSFFDPEQARGLEIGASDLPTVPPGEGRCEFADWRSTECLAEEFGLPIASLAPVTYVLDRERPIQAQIPHVFDYVILCHVIEHVADPVGYLIEIAALVRDGGVLLFAIPDKRQTLDAVRPSTTLDQLLARHYHRESSPSLEQVMEFARAWSDEAQQLAASSPRAFFDWSVSIFESGRQDAHCNVWRDDEFVVQLGALIRGGFLPGLQIAAQRPTVPPFNEFYVALRKLDPAAERAALL